MFKTQMQSTTQNPSTLEFQGASPSFCPAPAEPRLTRRQAEAVALRKNDFTITQIADLLKASQEP